VSVTDEAPMRHAFLTSAPGAQHTMSYELLRVAVLAKIESGGRRSAYRERRNETTT